MINKEWWLATVAVVLVGAALQWWLSYRTTLPLPTTSTSEQVESARRVLAEQSLSQWRSEIAVRRLDDPAPMVVRVRQANEDLSDHPGHVYGNGVFDRLTRWIGQAVDTGRTDRIDGLVKWFRHLQRQRVVVLGEAGTGKTTLAVLFMRALLTDLPDDEPVPVMVPLSDWDPDLTDLHEWLAGRIERDFPALKAGEYGPDVARAMVEQRRVLPVLDGMDELPDPVRPRVISALSAQTRDDRLILTCRTQAYRDAVLDDQGGVLTAAAVIETMRLTSQDAAAYLRSCLPSRPAAPWERVVTALENPRRAGAGSLTDALDTPLALWLFRTVYVETGRDPTELADAVRYPTPDAISAHLMENLVPAAVATNRPLPDASHPFRPRRAWDPHDMRRLGRLAHAMSRAETRDIAWWRLPHLMRWSEFHTAQAAIIGLVFGAFCWLLLLDGHTTEGAVVYGVLTGVAVALAMGMMFVLAAIRDGVRARGERVGFVAALLLGAVLGLVYAVVLGVIAALVVGLATEADGLAYGIAFGVVGGVAFGFVASRMFELPYRGRGSAALFARDIVRVTVMGAGYAAFVYSGLQLGAPLPALAWLAGVVVCCRLGVGIAEPAYTNLRLPRRARYLGVWLGRGLAVGVAIFVALVLSFALPVGLAWGLTMDDLPGGLVIGVFFGAIFGLGGGLAIALLSAVTGWATTPQPTDRPRSPRTGLRTDLVLNAVRLIVIAAAAGLAIVLTRSMSSTLHIRFLNGAAISQPDMRQLGDMLGVPSLSTLVLLSATIVGLALILRSASAAYLTSVLVLRLTGTAPWSLMALFEDAHRLGILRRVGGVYQFRHASLQDNLSRSRHNQPLKRLRRMMVVG
ncbi:MAG: NACHT domain-containing protein [Actinophytocola sp.]|uniref:NACHT domain-containing protein n=1 Tax=Actinophytocola sp. TaxID=1872138 RepID=UPI003C77AADD